MNKRKLITFKNVTSDIIEDIYLNGYLCSNEQYLRDDHHLSFNSYICSLVKKGLFDKSEIQPILKQFLKSN
jgi:hypothetical protein